MNKLEIRRQFMHIFLGVILMLLYLLDFIQVWGFGLLMLVFVAIIAISEQKDPFAYKFIKHYDRDHPILTGWGAFTFLKGFLIATVLFEKNIALAALAIMVFGDGFATLIGKLWGKHPLIPTSKKTIEGTLAGLVTAFFGALIFVSWPLAAIGAVIGMLAEIINKPQYVLDDNFLIPIASGLAMLLLEFLTNGFI